MAHNIGYHWAVMRTDADAMAEVGRLASAGALRPHVARCFALTDAAEAHALAESGAAGGKVVLTCEGGGDDVAGGAS